MKREHFKKNVLRRGMAEWAELKDLEPSDSAALSVVKINLLIVVGQSEYFIYLVF